MTSAPQVAVVGGGYARIAPPHTQAPRGAPGAQF